MADDETTQIIAGMRFYLSRGRCPHCGEEVEVRLQRVEKEAGAVVELKPAQDQKGNR